MDGRNPAPKKPNVNTNKHWDSYGSKVVRMDFVHQHLKFLVRFFFFFRVRQGDSFASRRGAFLLFESRSPFRAASCFAARVVFWSTSHPSGRMGTPKEETFGVFTFSGIHTALEGGLLMRCQHYRTLKIPLTLGCCNPPFLMGGLRVQAPQRNTK